MVPTFLGSESGCGDQFVSNTVHSHSTCAEVLHAVMMCMEQNLHDRLVNVVLRVHHQQSTKQRCGRVSSFGNDALKKIVS